MAHRAAHIPVVFIYLVYSFTSLFLYIVFAFAAFETVSTDSAFSARHMATVSIAAARDVR